MEELNPDPREAMWRRRPSETEHAGLPSQPELEAEFALNEALQRLPEAALPSNFTALVLNAIDLEEARLRRSAAPSGWHWNWRFLLSRAAITGVMLLFLGISLERHEAYVQRTQVARTLSMVVSDRAVPSVEALNNFDAIERISQSGRADTELLAALQ